MLPLLGTSSPERAVWLSFGFYLLNVLVPIVPAVIIYWLFPGGKTKTAAAKGGRRGQLGRRRKPTPDEEESGSSVEGTIGGWKIKAIGAWGAYVTAFLLGFWAINTTAIPLIKAVGGASVWTVESDVTLVDERGNEITAAINNLIVKPPIVETWGKHATITLFSPTLDPPEQLQVHLDNYMDQTVPLKDFPAKDGKIRLSQIKLVRLPDISSGPAPTPLPAGVGPPALTANR
jgi:hypothetical protein